MSFKPVTQWMLVQKSPRSEWAMTWTAASTRRGSRLAFIDGYYNRMDGIERLGRGLKDKTIRYAKVRIEELPK